MVRPANPVFLPPDLPDFERAEFTAFLYGGLHFSKQGHLVFTLAVEPADMDAALELRHLARNPLPLRVMLEADVSLLDEMAGYARNGD